MIPDAWDDPATSWHYDTWTATEPPSIAAVRAVAALTGREPTALPPLYDSLRVDAVDRLLAHARDREPAAVTVAFVYAGVRVVVSSDGTVAVADPPATPE